MNIIIKISEYHPDVDMVTISEKINIEEYKGTDVENEILNRFTSELKTICRDIEKNYI